MMADRTSLFRSVELVALVLFMLHGSTCEAFIRPALVPPRVIAPIPLKSGGHSTIISSTKHIPSALFAGLPGLEIEVLGTGIIPHTSSFASAQNLIAIDLIEVSKNIGIGIVSFALITLGILYFFANVIIPQAVVELEKQLREKDPELWQEYEAKLQPGETLATRPDLIQELGTKLRQMQLEEMNAAQAEIETPQQGQQRSEAGDMSVSNTVVNSSSSNKVIDAEVVKDDNTK